MSAHSHVTDEEHALGDEDQRKLEVIEEFKHIKVGVWDVYERIPRWKFGHNIPWISAISRNAGIIENLPLARRMVTDVIRVEGCRYHLCLLILVNLLYSLVPAAALWFTSHYLIIVQVAMDERRLDEKLLIFASVGRICCTIVGAVLRDWENKIVFPLRLLLQECSDKEAFSVLIKLDVPTYDDEAVKYKLDGNWRGPEDNHGGVVWQTLSAILDLFFSIVSLATSFGVLAKAIGGQRNGIIFAVMYLGQKVYNAPGVFFTQLDVFSLHPPDMVALTRNEHYIKLPGLEQLVRGSTHKKEIIGGNCAEFLEMAYKRAYAHVSGKRATFRDILIRSGLPGLQHIMPTIVPASIAEVAEVAYLIKSVARPETIPACLTTVRLIHTTGQDFVNGFGMILHRVMYIREQFRRLQQLYEIQTLQNKVPDGTISFPGDGQSLLPGITVEFRNVSFRYPNSDDFVLQNVSFKIERGKLCVIVGTNGSGKSTLLKLILRLYDPTEGTILVNDQDIRTLKLADLRDSMAVLFQDYTHFPLPIKDNIGLGDPRNAHDEAMVREAARLGGTEEFIDKLAEGFNTYLKRPVSDHWGVPSNAKTRSGVTLDPDSFRKAFGYIGNGGNIELSGGQMQRLALSRLFMRSAVSGEVGVGLLLFDEPSAALDPIAEGDLFTKLQKLRGEKTMIFSSHRFGRLTKPADLILYVKFHNTRVRI